MALDLGRIQEQIAFAQDIINNLLLNDQLNRDQVESFLDLLSPLVAELAEERGNLIIDLDNRPRPERNEAAQWFDSIAWTTAIGQTLLRKFNTVLARFRTDPAMEAATNSALDWARNVTGVAPPSAAGEASEAADDLNLALLEMQQRVRSLYSDRAYRRMEFGELFEDARYQYYIATFDQLSTQNINRLYDEIEALGGIQGADRNFIEQFRALPFYAKHATSLEGRNAIVNSQVLLSIIGLSDELPQPERALSGFTTGSDEEVKQDIDFVFFRVEIGSAAMTGTRYGDYQFAYPLEQLTDHGLLSLHDMLAPISSSNSLRELANPTDASDVLRTTEFFRDPENDEEFWEHTFLNEERPDGFPATREVSIMDEVFTKSHMLEGISLSVLRDIKELPTLQQWVYEALDDQATFLQRMRYLFPKLYRVEAKYPRFFDYGAPGRVDHLPE